MRKLSHEFLEWLATPEAEFRIRQSYSDEAAGHVLRARVTMLMTGIGHYAYLKTGVVVVSYELNWCFEDSPNLIPLPYETNR